MIPNSWDIMRMLERYRQLRHKGILDKERVKRATVTSLGCGDRITVYILLKDQNTIEEITFSALSGVTCAVVADLLIDRILDNKYSVDDVRAMDINSFLDEMGIALPPSKVRSARLPLDALKKALEGQKHGKNKI